MLRNNKMIGQFNEMVKLNYIFIIITYLVIELISPAESLVVEEAAGAEI